MNSDNIIIGTKIDSVKLELNGVEKILFTNLNFTLERGSIYTLLGNNGAGKTTFLNALLNLLDRRFYSVEGSINVLGRDVLNSSEEELLPMRQKSIRYIFQDAVNCFDPLRKIRYYFDSIAYDTAYLDELLEYFLLPEKEIIFNYYPYQLSGGIAQRIAIIWGIVSKPELLIIDEPNSALDIPLSVLLSKKLTEISRVSGLSILIVTQDLNFALNTDCKIGLLKQTGIREYINNEDNIDLIKKELNQENPMQVR